ncbi:hypothetical protein [Lysobacter sp. Hz 25]|uniref:hypothetical protein n=1 Tax=Lysobacter sp. Hz 25 TaxID=3383698 RepID=UPI0038D4C255
MLPTLGEIERLRRLLDVIDSVILACESEKVIPVSANVIAERVVVALGSTHSSGQMIQARTELCRDLAQLKLASTFEPNFVTRPVFECATQTLCLVPRTSGKYPDYVNAHDLSDSEAAYLYYALEETADCYLNMARPFKERCERDSSDSTR